MVRTSGVTDGQNHHSEQQQLRTKNIESHQRRLRLVGFAARRHPTIFEKQGLIWLLPSKNSSCQGLPPWWEIQQPISEILVESLHESSIRSFIIWNGTSQIIYKNTKTPSPSKKTFSLIQKKEILKKLNTKIQNIISNWNSARQQILVKETEMSCNLFSYLGGTNIRKHRWTKSSLRATATEYQNVWESSKKVEIGWFWRETTPNFSCKGNSGMTCLH